jgi:hypothetical protein
MRTTLLKDLSDEDFIAAVCKLHAAGAMPDTLVRTANGLTYMEWPEGKLIQAEMDILKPKERSTCPVCGTKAKK